jgi:hypothetical protein
VFSSLRNLEELHSSKRAPAAEASSTQVAQRSAVPESVSSPCNALYTPSSWKNIAVIPWPEAIAVRTKRLAETANPDAHGLSLTIIRNFTVKSPVSSEPASWIDVSLPMLKACRKQGPYVEAFQT